MGGYAVIWNSSNMQDTSMELAWWVWGKHFNMTFRLTDLWTEIWALCIHRTQTWHPLLRLGLHEGTAAFTHSHLCVCVSVCVCVLCLSVVFVCSVCLLCLCVVFVLFVCCVCVFPRYPELQQTLSLHINVTNVTILMSINTSNPVTAT